MEVEFAGAGRNFTDEENHNEQHSYEPVLEIPGLKTGRARQDLVEYALLVALIALVCVSGVNNVAGAVNTVFTKSTRRWRNRGRTAAGKRCGEG